MPRAERNASLRHPRRRLPVPLLAPLSLLAAFSVGCQTQEPREELPSIFSKGSRSARAKPEMIEADKVASRDDIVAINHFWPQDPWLRDASGRAVGFRVPVYFVSSETEKGAFVSGKILVWLHVLESLPGGGYRRTTEHIWEFDQHEAMNFRVRKKPILGYHYGFMLTWPQDLEIGGRLIEIEFGYERRDGRLIIGRAKRFRLDYVPRERITNPGAAG